VTKEVTKGYLALILAMLIWGSVGVVARKAGQDPLITVTYRVVFATATLALVELGRRRKGDAPGEAATRRRRGLLIFSGLALAANWLFFFKAVATTTVSNAVLAYYTAPVLVALAAPLLLKERLEMRTLIASSIAFGGVAMLYLPLEALTPGDMAGIGYGLIAAAFYAMVTISGRWLSGVAATRLVLVQTLVAALVLVPAVGWNKATAGAALHVPPWSLGLLAVIGVVHTALALVLYFYGLKHVKVQHVGVLAYLDPVSAVLFAYLFLGEQPTPYALLGGLLVLGGSALLLGPRRDRAASLEL
jgi:RarD protein